MISNSRISANLEARDGSVVTLLKTFSESYGASEFPNATMPITHSIPALQSYTTKLCGVEPGRLFILHTDLPIYLTYVGNPPEADNSIPLTAGVDEDDTTFQFADTSTFPYTGAAAMGEEIFTWTSKTATSLNGVARGAFDTIAVSHAPSGIGIATNLPVTKMYITEGALLSTYISHVIIDNPNSGVAPVGNVTIQMAAVGL